MLTLRFRFECELPQLRSVKTIDHNSAEIGTIKQEFRSVPKEVELEGLLDFPESAIDHQTAV